MPILSINTAYGNTDIALVENDTILSTYCDKEPGKQAETLFNNINILLEKSNVLYKDIKAITANIGPGSFTGIRIGLAAARGIALAANIPVIGVDGFAAINHSVRKQHNLHNLLVVFDAKRQQVFAQFFSHNQRKQLLLDYKDITKAIQQKSNINITGNGAELITKYLHENKITYKIIDGFTLPNASMIGGLANEYFSSGNYENNASPLYIRQPDAVTKKCTT